MNAAYDELPGVSASRLRTLGGITEGMNVVTVKLGEYEFTVGLSMLLWPNGGSWSFFVCPCGRRARILGCSKAASRAPGASWRVVFTRASNWSRRRGAPPGSRRSVWSASNPMGQSASIRGRADA
jgi:hypothetical protein